MSTAPSRRFANFQQVEILRPVRAGHAVSFAYGGGVREDEQPARRVDARPEHLIRSSVSPLIGLQKGASLELVECLPELGLGVHHDRPIPGDGFLKRLS